MTAFEDMKTAIAAMKAGAIEYLVKPLDLDVIDLTVERSFRERAVRRRMKHLSTEAAAPYSISDLVGARSGDDRHLQAHRNRWRARGRRCSFEARRAPARRSSRARSTSTRTTPKEPFVAVNCTAGAGGIARE
jgi:DNA-binding response OmpR family regulator